MSEPKTPESQETKPVREIDKQTQKHLDRFLKGAGAWNSWATSKLKEKEKLKKEGKWKVRYGVDKKLNWRYMSADHNNPEIQNWLDETYVDFSFITFTVKEFQKRAYEENYQIPKLKFFPKAPHKNKIIKVDTNDIDFERFIFPNGVDFTCCMFWGDANFYKTKFYEKAIFLNSTFNRHTHFRRACFYDEADFNLSYFYGSSDYSLATFNRNANFLDAKFKLRSEFEFTKFLGFRTDFSRVHFEESVSFWKAIFNGSASFSETSVDENAYFNSVKFRNEAIFDLVKFNGVARFFETCFYKYVSFNNTLFNK